MPITHAFVSGKADGGDATLVMPSHWNAAHTLPTHNETSSKQGGTTNEYYHLTSAQHAEVVLIVAAIEVTGGNVVMSATGAINIEPTENLVLKVLTNKEIQFKYNTSIKAGVDLVGLYCGSFRVAAIYNTNTGGSIEYNTTYDTGGDYSHQFYCESSARLRIGLTGVSILNGSLVTATALLDIVSDVIRLRTAKTPASASAAGNQGDLCWDSNYFYVCTATNTWKRVPIATW